STSSALADRGTRRNALLHAWIVEDLVPGQWELARSPGAELGCEETEALEIGHAMAFDEQLGEALREQPIQYLLRREARRIECRKIRRSGRAIAIHVGDCRRELSLPPRHLGLDEVHLALRCQRDRIGIVRVFL